MHATEEYAKGLRNEFIRWSGYRRNFIPVDHKPMAITDIFTPAQLNTLFRDDTPDFAAVETLTDDPLLRYNLAVRLAIFSLTKNLLPPDEAYAFAHSHGLYLTKENVLRPHYRTGQTLTVTSLEALEQRKAAFTDIPLDEEELWARAVHGSENYARKDGGPDEASMPAVRMSEPRSHLSGPKRTAGRPVMDIIEERQRGIPKLFDGMGDDPFER
ncbi:MAG: hypothetical protein K2X09_03310 [Rickettsiales bacterium]|nr:hypothetical protein [Rickettsiales bacterium]